MNKKQFDIITKKLFKTVGIRAAIHDVIFNNDSAYVCEKRYSLPTGTLSRQVRKYRDHVDYINSVIAGGPNTTTSKTKQ